MSSQSSSFISPRNSSSYDAFTSQSSFSGPLTRQKKSNATSKIIKNKLASFFNGVQRIGIAFTVALPFSSRGILAISLRISAVIPIKLIQNVGKKDFSKNIKRDVASIWNSGIHDSFRDLESPKYQDLKNKIVTANLPYAAYMYMGFSRRKKLESQNALILPIKYNNVLEKYETSCGQEIVKNQFQDLDVLLQLESELEKLGFEEDLNGNFFNIKTGTLFNIIYDTKTKDLVICFMGLGNERSMNLNAKTKKTILKASIKSILGDWFGGVPAAAIEGINIGKALKKITSGTEITPVLVGHSHGGGIAQVGAVANGIKGIAFNSRPIGPGVRRYIGQSKIAKNARNITVFNGKRDWLTQIKAVNKAGIIFERITGIPVARSLGVGYLTPALNKTRSHEHLYFYKKLAMLNNT